MKPSALGLILFCHCRLPRRIPAGQHNQFVLWRKGKLIYKSRTSLLINFSLCVLSSGLDHLKPQAVLWLKFEAALIAFSSLFCKSPLSCPSPLLLQFHSACRWIIPVHCTLCHLCVHKDTHFSISYNNDLTLPSLYLTSNFPSLSHFCS